MKRQYTELIREYLNLFPCVVIIGARQTGKSTLMGMVAPAEREYFDLELRADYNQIARDPDLFLSLQETPLAIDEAQLLPELFPALRVAIDRDRKGENQAKGRYLLSGSSSPSLIRSISESLAGRVGIIELAPFSYSETMGVNTPNLLSLFATDDSAIQQLRDWSGKAIESDQAHHPNQKLGGWLGRDTESDQASQVNDKLHGDHQKEVDRIDLGASETLTRNSPRSDHREESDQQGDLGAADQLARYWFRGGYPEPWLENSARFSEVWTEQYIQTYIERDIAWLFPNLNSVRYRRFIELLAGYSGSIINFANVARLLDVSQPTARDYFEIAQGTFLWRTLPAYSKSASKRVVKHPKGYLRDSGLLHHILQIPSHRKLLTHPQMGASWEAMVIEEILRSLNAAGITHKAYHYRTSSGAEVDLVLEGKFGLIPIEIKYAQSVGKGQLRSLQNFVNEFNCNLGLVVNNDTRIRRYNDKLFGVPFTLLTS